MTNSDAAPPLSPAAAASDEAKVAPAIDLRQALRRARVTEAEHAKVIADVRAGEIARLEQLQATLAPAMAQIPPEHAIMFEGGLVTGATPRLWVDILSHVVMARDKKTYQFVSDGRAGRQVLGESADVNSIAAKIIDYMAHRIVERERAMDSAPPSPGAAMKPQIADAPVPAPRLARADAPRTATPVIENPNSTGWPSVADGPAPNIPEDLAATTAAPRATAPKQPIWRRPWANLFANTFSGLLSGVALISLTALACIALVKR